MILCIVVRQLRIFGVLWSRVTIDGCILGVLKMENLGEVDCIVMGAGVVGLACARALAKTGREVLVLEAEARIGEHTSGRNSEVIHAGIYYPQDSLKARLCVEGKHQLYHYLEKHGIGHRRLGKLIVAGSAEELPTLERYRVQAAGNGVNDLELLDQRQVQQLEPALAGALAGLLSPSTGILDTHGYMLALQGDLEAAGGTVAFHAPVSAVGRDGQGFQVDVGQQYRVSCKWLVNATGLQAWQQAHNIHEFPEDKIPPCYYAKGHYMTYSGTTPFNRLVYPLAQVGGLGIHLTLDMGGQARFGPDVVWVERPDYRFEQDMSQKFAAAIRCYWPELDASRLQAGYVGVRPKLVGPGEPAADFLVQDETQHGFAGLIQLFGIESPGLTASLALGDYVLTLLEN
jgi:L-2-hydroxyglutarate oxidase LhgO